ERHLGRTPDEYICTKTPTNYYKERRTGNPSVDLDVAFRRWIWPWTLQYSFQYPWLSFNGRQRDISWDISNMPQLPRPAFQKWIWWNMESPSNSHPIGPLNGLFNLTSNYRRDSDIPVPYEEQKKYTIPKKDKLVCWIVSNYSPSFKRSQYYDELKKHIDVSVYGRYFNNPVSDADYSNLVSSCKFYLSFENSVHRDYMTEKLFNALALGTVPVVLGPPRDNYEQFIPSNAFIHVDDFPTAKEMADHLNHLDQNEELYMQFFTWRERLVSKGSAFGLDHACRICDHIRRNKEYKVVKDLNGWYWG
ncbi:hypothetical protein M9458_038797, partial [Cirrhinus mrigala]